MDIQNDSTKVTFTQVYGDVKETLQALGESLKVGAEHVYEVLVTQQIVNSITWLAILCVLITSTAICAYYCNKFSSEKSKNIELRDGFGWGTLIIGTIAIIVFLCTIETIVTGFVNPEYGAMKEIMEFVK